MMKLSDLDAVRQLHDELIDARAALLAFQESRNETCEAVAFSDCPGIRSYRIRLVPVPKAQAIAAAQAAHDEVVAKLAAFGVEA